ncbi:hypothetical protein MKY07_14955 [Solibacillus sp. FSL W7-1472]|uniref:Uncharacterized protein n=2 Tax=Solibacillus TaxID=648800 RepID=F2F6J5_SOLSS|nr:MULTISPECIES: hypothetical protein [Solibacillus]AMO86521.1 hypothetical protein SOLI23_13415 [Solibacillus silvestris]EKB45100.1 hypothetical protein B857_01979 [Solibacillus isronensis B3W22]OBW57208.1 hypothetical protein A9986_10725 [Solibacillus silvestris]BAK15437.1 hypothetical protein SSIL_1014 [Solibacillus silvestris StLB046]
MSLSKKGYLVLFVGILLLISSIFFTTNWSITSWLVLFIVSLLFCTVGIIMLIVHLVKQIKLEKQNK